MWKDARIKIWHVIEIWALLINNIRIFGLEFPPSPPILSLLRRVHHWTIKSRSSLSHSLFHIIFTTPWSPEWLLSFRLSDEKSIRIFHLLYTWPQPLASMTPVIGEQWPCGSLLGSGTKLKASRAQFRFPMRSLDFFFFWTTASSCTKALGSTQPLTEINTMNLKVKGSLRIRMTHHLWSDPVEKYGELRCLKILWTFTACYKDNFNLFISLHYFQHLPVTASVLELNILLSTLLSDTPYGEVQSPTLIQNLGIWLLRKE
jgi:hypothetical protein